MVIKKCHAFNALVFTKKCQSVFMVLLKSDASHVAALMSAQTNGVQMLPIRKTPNAKHAHPT
jgi:hypothetical protein